ncbi:methyltransferase domain-containing protein, partial [Photorhabdus noenieputensis]|uniref:condensation domain-containing protein n=1 Tax=Photorhabdus noenieputensis TaxID=1208607 RepID=UPI001BD54E1F
MIDNDFILEISKKNDIGLEFVDDELNIILNDNFDEEVYAEIRERKEELLEYFKCKKIIKRVAKSSYSQRRLFFISNLENNSGLYNITYYLNVSGRVNHKHLNWSINQLIERHESLRTVYQETDGEILQIVLNTPQVEMPVIDIAGLDETEVENMLAVEAGKAFDLSSDLMLRATLLQRSEQEYLLLLTIHHIAADGWSLGIIIRELNLFYKARQQGEFSPLIPLVQQYADYAYWQREQLRNGSLKEAELYWSKQLEELPAVHNLPLDHPRPAEQEFHGAVHYQVFNEALTEKLNYLSQKQGVTLFMTLQAAFAVLLSRYSNETDIVMGTPIAGRSRAELEDLVGLFVNTLVLRTNLSGNPSFSELLKQTKTMALNAYTYQDYPFDLLVEKLNPVRSLSYNPVFQIMFAFNNYQRTELSFSEVTFTRISKEWGGINFDLILNINENNGVLDLIWEYNSDIFEKEKIEVISRSLKCLIEEIILHTNIGIKQLNLISEKDKEGIKIQFNEIQDRVNIDDTIVSLFKQQASSKGNKLAIKHNTEFITYKELDYYSDLLAKYIISEFGMPDEDECVGVFLEKSIEYIISVLAILKSGRCYVPLDINIPHDRLEYIFQDSSMKSLITKPYLEERLVGIRDVGKILLGDVINDYYPIDGISLPKIIGDQRAYIIYTSGSTGLPKGVIIKHASVVNLANWQCDYFNLKDNSVISQLSSVSFDASIGETVMALLNGGTLVLIDQLQSPEDIISDINENSVSVMVVVPSVLKLLEPEEIISLNNLTIVSVGEALPKFLAQKWAKKCRLINGYGPTEYTIYSHVWEVLQHKISLYDKLPIGKPISNTRTYIVDDELNVLPPGAVGEICLSGLGIAQGYTGNRGYDKFLLNKQYIKDFITRCEFKIEYEAFNNIHCSEKPVKKLNKVKDFFFLTKEEKIKYIFENVSTLDEDIISDCYAMFSENKDNDFFLNAFFRYCIESFYSTYHSFGINKEVISFIFGDHIHGLKGADIGCGAGEVLKLLTSLGCDVIGVDICPFFVNNLRLDGYDARLARIDCNFSDFYKRSEIKERSLDFVISNLVLDRVADPYQYLVNTLRLVKPGGKFSIQTLLPIIVNGDGDSIFDFPYSASEKVFSHNHDAKEDEWILSRLLLLLGAKNIKIFNFPYYVNSADGDQKYNVWSFSGEIDLSFNIGKIDYTTLYRTGDLGRILPDGELEYIGRIDQQLKYNGIRIEPGEIESLLRTVPGVVDAVVQLREDHPGEKRLAAYLVAGPDPSDPALLTRCHHTLTARLPDYMHPAAWALLPALPLMPSGKLDWRALPVPVPLPQDPDGYVAPVGEAERLLCDIWQAALHLPQVGVNDNFFTLGGDSILAIQVTSRAVRAGLAVSVRQLFEHKTVRGLAAHLGAVPAVSQAALRGEVGLHPVQQRFFAETSGEYHHYNQSLRVSVPADFSLPRLAQLVTALYERHDGLRLRYRRGPEGRWGGQYDETPLALQVAASIQHLRVSGEAQVLAARAAQRSLSLEKGPLLRAVYFDEEDGRGTLLLVMHHLIVDGVSWRIVLDDMAAGYGQIVAGEAVRLAPKTSGYPQWLARLQAYAGSEALQAERGYWQDQLLVAGEGLAVDYPGAGASLQADSEE